MSKDQSQDQPQVSDQPDVKSADQQPSYDELQSRIKSLEDQISEQTKIPQMSIGTPPTSSTPDSVDILNSKSVEWMANNIDKVNSLISV